MPIHVLYSGESQMYSWDSHIAVPHIMWAISHTNDIQYNKLKLKVIHKLLFIYDIKLFCVGWTW